MHIIIYHRYNPTWPPCCRHFAHHRSSIIQMAERSYPRMTIWSPSDRLDRSVKAPSQSIHRFTHNLQERTGVLIYISIANICKWDIICIHTMYFLDVMLLSFQFSTLAGLPPQEWSHAEFARENLRRRRWSRIKARQKSTCHLGRSLGVGGSSQWM